MPVNVSQQTIVFFLCVLTGMASGIIFDILSITAKKLRFNKSAVFVQDVFIWVVIVSFFFTVLYTVNGAMLRWYVFVGGVLGGLIYIFEFREANVKAVALAVDFVMSFFRKMLKILGWPVKKILIIFRPFKKYVQIARKKHRNFVQKNIEKIRRIRVLLKKV